MTECGTHQLPGGVIVDVYTTHLSLSETARERTVLEIWDFIQDSRMGDLQVWHRMSVLWVDALYVCLSKRICAPEYFDVASLSYG